MLLRHARCAEPNSNLFIFLLFPVGCFWSLDTKARDIGSEAWLTWIELQFALSFNLAVSVGVLVKWINRQSYGSEFISMALFRSGPAISLWGITSESSGNLLNPLCFEYGGVFFSFIFPWDELGLVWDPRDVLHPSRRRGTAGLDVISTAVGWEGGWVVVRGSVRFDCCRGRGRTARVGGMRGVNWKRRRDGGEGRGATQRRMIQQKTRNANQHGHSVQRRVALLVCQRDGQKMST